MTEPTLNRPLLRRMVKWVEEQEALPVEKREWDQRSWAGCVAGKIVADAGHPIDDDVPDVAGELLGVETYWPEEGNLFGATNSAADIRRIAEFLAGEKL